MLDFHSIPMPRVADPMFPARITNPNTITASEGVLKRFANADPNTDLGFDHHDWIQAICSILNQIWPEIQFDAIEFVDTTTAFVEVRDSEFAVDIVTSGSVVDRHQIKRLETVWTEYLCIISTVELTERARDYIKETQRMEYAVVTSSRLTGST
jgi:hypothetical protein